MTLPASRTLVIDASAMGALLFGEAEAASMVSVVAGFRLSAPTLITTELTSIALKKIRRNGEDENAVAAALAGFADFQVTTVETPSALLIRAALRSNLTAYDASYLLLAAELGVPLVTLDKDLARACAEAGVEARS